MARESSGAGLAARSHTEAVSRGRTLLLTDPFIELLILLAKSKVGAEATDFFHRRRRFRDNQRALVASPAVSLLVQGRCKSLLTRALLDSAALAVKSRKYRADKSLAD